MSGERAQYADVGAAIRQAQARLTELHAPGPCWRLVLAIVATVQSYSRLSDRVPVYATAAKPGKSIAERARLSNDKAGKGLRWLAQRGVIVYEPGRPGRVSLVGLPAVATTHPSGMASCPESARFASDYPSASDGTSHPSGMANYPSATDGLPRRTREKTSEEKAPRARERAASDGDWIAALDRSREEVRRAVEDDVLGLGAYSRLEEEKRREALVQAADAAALRDYDWLLVDDADAPEPVYDDADAPEVVYDDHDLDVLVRFDGDDDAEDATA